MQKALNDLERRRLLQEWVNGLREALRGPARGQALDDFISRIQAENEDTLPQRKADLANQKNQNLVELEAVQKSLRELEGQRGILEKASDEAAGFRQQAESEAAALKQDAARFIRLPSNGRAPSEKANRTFSQGKPGAFTRKVRRSLSAHDRKCV